MSYELLYTSAQNGLRSGSRGFTTVLATQGLPSNLANRLETLSGYRHVFSPQDARAAENPIGWSHVLLRIGGQPLSVLSRVSAYGVDYSGRTNKLAHHVVVAGNERPAAGPAWLLQQPAVMRQQWGGQCETPAVGPTIPAADQQPAPCRLWEKMTGDAGWAAVVSEALSGNAAKPLWIISSIEQQQLVLALLAEAIAILPAAKRWNATFSTYYTNLPPEVDCKVRCVLAGSEEAKAVMGRGTVIDLTGKLSSPPASPLAMTAHTGQPAIANAAAPQVGTETSRTVSNPGEAVRQRSVNPTSSVEEEFQLAPPMVLNRPPQHSSKHDFGSSPELPPPVQTPTARYSMLTAAAAVVAIVILTASMTAWVLRQRGQQQPLPDSATQLADVTATQPLATPSQHQLAEAPPEQIAAGEDQPAAEREQTEVPEDTQSGSETSDARTIQESDIPPAKQEEAAGEPTNSVDMPAGAIKPAETTEQPSEQTAAEPSDPMPSTGSDGSASDSKQITEEDIDQQLAEKLIPVGEVDLGQLVTRTAGSGFTIGEIVFPTEHMSTHESFNFRFDPRGSGQSGTVEPKSLSEKEVELLQAYVPFSVRWNRDNGDIIVSVKNNRKPQAKELRMLSNSFDELSDMFKRYQIALEDYNRSCSYFVVNEQSTTTLQVQIANFNDFVSQPAQTQAGIEEARKHVSDFLSKDDIQKHLKEDAQKRQKQVNGIGNIEDAVAKLRKAFDDSVIDLGEIRLLNGGIVLGSVPQVGDPIQLRFKLKASNPELTEAK